MQFLWSNGFTSFLVVTLLLGGGAAYMTGRAVAGKWGPWWQMALYCVLLSLAVRFLHYALFQDRLLSASSWFIDLVYLVSIGFLGFRLTRVRQMVSQYRWQYERAGLFWWRERKSV